MAQNDHRVPAFVVLGGGEITAHRWMDTQGGEKVRCHVSGEDLLGLALTGQRRDPVGGGCDVLEGLSMIAPLLVVGKRRIDTRRAGRRVRFKQRDKPVGGGIGRRLEKHCAHDTENRCVRADTQDGQQYGTGRLQESPEGEAQVVHGGIVSWRTHSCVPRIPY